MNMWPKMSPFNEYVSDEFRMFGNESYQFQQYDKAIKEYNISLYYSSVESHGILYANRAAAYLSLSLYQDCMDSIRLAKECPLPANVLKKVLARERVAIEGLKSEATDNKVPIQLSYRRHKHISSFVHCLSPKDQRNQSAGIITTKNLLPGDILIIEPPLMTYNYHPGQCTNCLRECGSLQKCKCSELFCSHECKSEAFATYHNYECPLAEFLMCYNIEERLTLRVFFKIIQCFKNVQSFREYLEKIKSPPNPFDIQVEDQPDREMFESHFRVFYAQREPLDIQKSKDLLIMYAKTSIIIDLLKNVKQIPLAAETSDDWSFLSEQLFRLFIHTCWTQKAIVNSQIRYVQNGNGEEELDVHSVKEGSITIHGNASLIRSTSGEESNVLMDYENNMLIVRAMKRIPCGTELMCSKE